MENKDRKNIAKQLGWLGKVTEFFEVGNYVIAKYDDKKSGLPLYHPYVDGENTSESYDTLDAALAGAIAYRKEGPNHRADRYFIKGMVA